MYVIYVIKMWKKDGIAFDFTLTVKTYDNSNYFKNDAYFRYL